MDCSIKVSGMVGKPGFIPGKAGVDYPDFKIIPETDFTCQNFLLPGFYADTFTSCQVKHFFIFCYIYKHGLYFKRSIFVIKS